MNIICFGFGQVAKNFIKKLKDQGVTFKLTTTSREESKTKEFENINYESFQLTEEGFDKNLSKRFEEADHILISIAPIHGVDIVIKNFKENLKSNKVLINKPEGGFYLMPEFLDKKFKTSSEMCDNILKDTGVALLPGSDFGFDKKKMLARLALQTLMVRGLWIRPKMNSRLKLI